MKEADKRLKELRKKLDIKQGEFAKRIGLKQGSYSDVENGKEVLTQRNIKLICLEFGVSDEWLRNGQGPMFTPPKPPSQAIAGPDGRELASDERELLETYDRLIPETRKEVRDYAGEKLELQELRAKTGGTDAPQNAPGGATLPLEATREAEGGGNPVHNKDRG
jgi:transcriptional regulator with XRE-family HTH domain